MAGGDDLLGTLTIDDISYPLPNLEQDGFVGRAYNLLVHNTQARNLLA